MSELEVVHPVPVDEAEAWARAMATTFLGDPGDAAAAGGRLAALVRDWQPERAWGIREGSRWVATLYSDDRRMTVPGAAGSTLEVPVDAVTRVTVSATHRRRGLLSEMIRQARRAALARGEAISALIAAEWPIYGRFGYGPAAFAHDLVLDVRRVGGFSGGDPSRVRPVTAQELGAVAEGVFDACRCSRAGQLDRSGPWWPRRLGLEGYEAPDSAARHWFLHDGPDGPDGLLGWHPTRDWSLLPPFAEIAVEGPFAAEPTAARDLWAYLAGMDVVEKATLALRPVDEPAGFLLGNGRALRVARAYDMLWLALLEIPAALASRRYAAAGEVVLEVLRRDAPALTVALAGDGEHARCEVVDAAPALTLTEQALACVFLGGVRLGRLALAGEVRERTPGAIGLADVMFSTSLAPWNATWF